MSLDRWGGAMETQRDQRKQISQMTQASVRASSVIYIQWPGQQSNIKDRKHTKYLKYLGINLQER